MNTKFQKICFGFFFFFIMQFAAFAQKVTLSTANEANSKLINGTFLSTLRPWVTNDLSSGWTSSNSKAKVTGATTTNMAILSQTYTNVQNIDGYLIFQFDVKLRHQNGNITFQVLHNDVNYLTIMRNGNSESNVKLTAFNDVIIDTVLGAWNNSNNDTNLTTIRLRIPTNINASRVNGKIGFAYTSTSNNSYVVLDNVYSIEATHQLPSGTNCPNCLPLNLTEDGFMVTGDAPLVTDCNNGSAGAANLNRYYLPAIPEDRNDRNGPATMVISSEYDATQVTLRRPNGDFVAQHIVYSGTPLVIATSTEDMLVEMYGNPSASEKIYSGKGYIIEATNMVTVRWNLNNENNKMSVVLSGKHSVGKAFRVASVLNATRGIAGHNAEGDHYFTIMALENNTKVQIGNVANAVTTNQFKIITLQKGQQYTAVSNTVPVSGRLILSDKPVVVASGQHHKRIMTSNSSKATSTSMEGTVLQVMPIVTLGKEYLVLETQGWFGYQVVAVNNGTVVKHNDKQVAFLNAGESYQYYIDLNASGTSHNISTNKNAYVYNLGSNSIGEFEMFPGLPIDMPVGKASKTTVNVSQGNSGWVIINSSDAAKLRRNNLSTLGASSVRTFAEKPGISPEKTIYYYNNNFTVNGVADFSCIDCNGMFIGQLNDGGEGGAQVGYVSSFDGTPIQFYNTKELPNQLLTYGYSFDSLNYFEQNISQIGHRITVATGGTNNKIDSIVIHRASSNSNLGSVQSINNNDLSFVINLPPSSSVNRGTLDTVYTTVYVSDGYNNSALCLSYILMNINPLPVTLLSFDAKKEEQAVELSWKTSNERDNKGFMVQKSIDGQVWSDLMWIPSNEASGTSDLVNHYTYTDKNPQVGANYYRLQQEDFNGSKEWSQIRLVQFSGAQNTYSVFPNPTTSNVTINGLGNKEQVILTTVSGVVLLNENTQSAQYQVKMEHLTAGVYLLQITQPNGTAYYHKIVKH